MLNRKERRSPKLLPTTRKSHDMVCFPPAFCTPPHRIETLTKDLLSKAQGRVAVRLRPQASSEEEDGGGGRGAEDEESDGVEANGGIVFSKDCLPAFRFERGGLAFDEYHTHGDVPFEEELTKRVEAALSLSRPEDACEFSPRPLLGWFACGDFRTSQLEPACWKRFVGSQASKMGLCLPFPR